MCTAIVVDDESITRMDFTGLLAELGVEVLGEASDGFDAVELCRAKRPDVVLMDLEMSIFGGQSALERIVQEDLAGSVIVITAYCDEPTILRVVRAGASGYLTKPVNRMALFAALHLAVESRRKKDGLCACIRELESAAEEARMVDRAKAHMAQAYAMTEAEAYRRMQKLAMDKRCGMGAIAQHYMENNGGDVVRQVKQLLMRDHGCSEKAAFKRIKTLAEERGCSMEEAAKCLMDARRPR